MNSYVTDTQALVKFMTGKKVINDKAHQAFENADKGEAIIIIPAIVLMEVLYLFEKKRIDISILNVDALLESRNYRFEPLDMDILKEAFEITDIPELHDRLIAATARFLDLQLITNDPEIKASKFVDVLE